MEKAFPIFFCTVALCCSELYYLVDSADDAVGVLATCGGEVGLSAAAALDELGCLAHELSGIDALGGEVFAGRYGEQGLVAIDAADDYEQVLGLLATELEHDVLHGIGRHGHYGLDDVDAIYASHLLYELGLERCGTLLHELLDLSLEVVVLGDELHEGALEVGSVVEELAYLAHAILQAVEHLLYLGSGDGLDTAYTGSNAALADDLDHTDLTCGAHVGTAAELDGVAKLHYAYVVAVLLAEEGDGAQLAGLLDGQVAVFVELDVGAYLGVDEVLYLAQLLIGDLLEV